MTDRADASIDGCSRRTVLTGTAGLGVASLAGCVDVIPGGDDASSDDGAPDEDGPAVPPEDRLPAELPTDPADADFVDRTGTETVEVETREGVGDEPAFVFGPPFVTVDADTTVRWVNADGVFHTITSTPSLDSRSGGGAVFDASISAVGDAFEWTPGEPGLQAYYCSPHAGFMFGAIEVV